MIRHYLLLAVRNFQRSKSEFLINVIGLTSGLTGFILIYLWVNDEVRFDQFHIRSMQLYQVMEHQQQQGDWWTHSNTEGYLGSTLISELPEVENAVAVTPDNFFPQFTMLNGSTMVNAKGRFAEHGFFEMFSFDLIQGNASLVLREKVNVVISESLSRRLFGEGATAVGKTISWDVLNIRRDVTVTGVFRDVPANSSFQFDFILPFDSFREIMGMNSSSVNWDNTAPFETYVLLREQADPEVADLKVNAFLHSKASNAAGRRLFLKPFAEKYLHGKYQNGALAGGRIQYVIILSTIGGLILLIACINFVNLYTAKALARIKQIGIKKAMGAERITLMAQYLSESTLIVILAMTVSVALATWLLPYFNTLTSKTIHMIFDLRMVGALLTMAIATSLLAGAYPAFYLSGFNAARTMKGETITSSSHMLLRKGLSVFQFSLSVIFVAGLIITNEQLKFIQREDLGFRRDNVVYFPAEGKIAQDVQSFLSELDKLDGIGDASSMLGNIISPADGDGFPLKIDERTIMLHNIAVNYGWFELLGLDVIEGRVFSADRSGDTDKIVCNEEAVRAIGLIDPIGKTIGGKEIIGVVRDFHFQSFHQEIKPLVIRLEPQAVTTVLARIVPGQEENSLRELERVYKSVNPGYVFDYHFLDENFEALYVAEKRVRAIAQAAAVLAVVITCLGLFGLSSYLIERRSKEVSIRKILGSSVLNILGLLSFDYFKIVLTAIVIAVPVSIYIAWYWLSGYAYRIELNAWYFIMAPLAIFGVAVIALALQTVKAALVNPLNRLRSE